MVVLSVSSVLKNRFPLEQTKEVLDRDACSQVWVKNAKSMDDLEAIVRDAKRVSKELKFIPWVKIENYAFKSFSYQPNYYIPEFGEEFLWFLLCGEMLDMPYYFRGFENLQLFEWSHILYNRFDLNEMEARQRF
ncbi:hypothetical protein O9992_19405 [Vibrio lentus]|nr:hypothetical protein [Vibrio lentus]